MSDSDARSEWRHHKANVDYLRSLGATDRELYEMQASIDLDIATGKVANEETESEGEIEV